MQRIPVALQLFSVREDCARDLRGTLKAVAEIGYEGVEFAGFHNHGAKEIKQWLAEYGLKPAGAHVPLPALEGEDWKATLDFHLALGNRFLIVPGIPTERRQTLDDWRKLVDIFNTLAEQAAQHGLRIGFHNHMVEFELVDGKRPWEIIFDAVRPDFVMQIDTGNALRAGIKAENYLRRYAGRATTVHLKEHSAVKEKALIGEGDVNWPAVFELCETIGGTKWYIVEEERRPFPPLESVRRCFEALKRMGKTA